MIELIVIEETQVDINKHMTMQGHRNIMPQVDMTLLIRLTLFKFLLMVIQQGHLHMKKLYGLSSVMKS